MDWLFHQLLTLILHLLLLGHFGEVTSDNNNNNNTYWTLPSPRPKATSTLLPNNQYFMENYNPDLVETKPEKKSDKVEMTTAKMNSVLENTPFTVLNSNYQISLDVLIKYLRFKYSMDSDDELTIDTLGDTKSIWKKPDHNTRQYIFPPDFDYSDNIPTLRSLIVIKDEPNQIQEMQQNIEMKPSKDTSMHYNLPSLAQKREVTETEANNSISLDTNHNLSTTSVINKISMNNEAIYDPIALPQQQHLLLLNETNNSNITDHKKLQMKMDAADNDADMFSIDEVKNHNNVINWLSRQQEPLLYVVEPLSNNDTINRNDSIDEIDKQQILTTTESSVNQEPVHDSNEITAHASFPGFHFPFDSLWQITDTTVPTTTTAAAAAVDINHFSTAPVPVSAVIPVVPKHTAEKLMPTAEVTEAITTTDTYFLPTIIQNKSVNHQHHQQQQRQQKENDEEQQQQQKLLKDHQNHRNQTISTTDKNMSDNNNTTNVINIIPTTTRPLPSTFMAIRSTSTPSLSYSNPDKKAKQIPVVLLQDPLEVSTSGPSLALPQHTLPVRNQMPLIKINYREPANNNNNNGDKRRIMALLPQDQLRNYIEDAYIRIPLAVIVDPTASNQLFERMKPLWNEALRTNINIQIVLLTLNALGSTPSVYHFENSRQFLNGLNSIREENFVSNTNSNSNSEKSNSKTNTDVFLGILQAAELIPFDSAIFVTATDLPIYSELVHETALTLLKKRIRLYLLWYGEKTISENETQESVAGTLGEVALRSGGDIIVVKGTTIDKTENAVSKNSNFYHKMSSDSLLFERKSSNKLMRRHVREVRQQFTDQIFANPRNHELLDNNHLVNQNYMNFNTDLSRIVNNPKLNVETISDNSLSNLNEWEEIDNHNFTTFGTTMASYRNDIDNVFLLQKPRKNAKLEMGVNSQILIMAGTYNYLYFDITNIDTETILYNIQVTDEKRYLIHLSAKRILLRSGETITARVTVSAPTGTETDAIDHVTFSVNGKGVITHLSVILRVINSLESQDDKSPSIDWSFSRRCRKSISSNSDGSSFNDAHNCANDWWSMDILAQDFESGILRLLVNPGSGLYYTHDYTVGEREPIKAIYTARCCEPKVSLIAYDAAGNQRAYNVDVRDIVLNEEAIAAISLGVILLILLIVLIILSCVWCYRRRKIVADIPSYRSHSPRGFT